MKEVTNICKQRICEGGPKAKEDGEMFVVNHSLQITCHRTIWVFPVAEANAVMAGVSACTASEDTWPRLGKRTEVDDDSH